MVHLPEDGNQVAIYERLAVRDVGVLETAQSIGVVDVVRVLCDTVGGEGGKEVMCFPKLNCFG